MNQSLEGLWPNSGDSNVSSVDVRGAGIIQNWVIILENLTMMLFGDYWLYGSTCEPWEACICCGNAQGGCFVFLLSFATLQCLSLLYALSYWDLWSISLFSHFSLTTETSYLLLPLLLCVISSLPFFISKELVFSVMLPIHSVNVRSFPLNPIAKSLFPFYELLASLNQWPSHIVLPRVSKSYQ